MHAWQTRSGSLALVALLFLCDVAASVLVCFSVHGWDRSAVSSSWASAEALKRFGHDAADLVMLSLVRVAALTFLTWAGVHWGTPPHEKAADARRAQLAKREKAWQEWRRQKGIVDDCAGLDEEQRGGATTVKSGAVSGDDKRQPLLSVQEQQLHVIHSDATNGTQEWSSEEDARAAFELTQPVLPAANVLSDPEKLVQSRGARLRRGLLVALLFVVATGMQVYLGVKMVGFSFRSEWTEGLLMGFGIVAVNLEQTLLRRVVDHLTAEEGYLIPPLHPHRIFYDETAAGHWCDLCRSRIRAAYRCTKCDFDCCPRCFKKKDRSRGEGQLRGEKGTKDEQEVSSTAYMIRALKLAWPHKWIICVAFACLIATSAASIVLPNYQGSILDSVIKSDKSRFAWTIKLYIFISVGQGLLGGVRALSFNLVGSHIANDVRNRLFRAIVSQDIVYFDGVSTGELTSRLSSDTAAMTSPMQTVLSATLSNLLLLVGGFVMCLLTSWRLTVLALTSIYPIVLITRSYATWSSAINKQIWAALGDASTVANQAISNIRTVRSFGTEEHEVKKYTTATAEALDKSIADSVANGGTYALTNYLDLATSVLLLWYGGSVAMGQHSGTLTVGRLITFQLYWGMMNNSYSSLISVLNSFTRASGAAQRVLTLMDNLPDISPHGGLELDEVRGEIRIEDLSFHYQMRPDNPVLRGVSLTIPANTVTALVGRSGGGKSSLVSLLMRFYEPTSGRILLDGHDYRDLHLGSVHRHMAVVTQTTELFRGTILENLTYGIKEGEWTQAQVEEACKQANAHEFIVAFEEGYETRVGERGVRLSGGQKQRLSIARAMLRNASLLLLDEATSSLDGESEALVQAALDRLIARGRCTILLVAHRLSTVINADQICVLDGGRIAERGTHQQLLDQDGLYAKLVHRQLARKQNLVDDQALEAAAKDHQDHEKLQQAKKEKLEKLDDFDSLFEEEKEQTAGPAPAAAAGVGGSAAGASASGSAPGRPASPSVSLISAVDSRAAPRLHDD